MLPYRLSISGDVIMSNSTGPDFVPGICTQCGAPIEVDPSIEAAVCPFCGTPYVTTKAIEKYYIVNNVRNSNDVYNIQQGKKGVAQSVFEYMDKRASAKETAKAEERAAAAAQAERMRVLELEAKEEARRQALEEKERERAQKERNVARRALIFHQIGQIALWSVFFPIMLVYTVLRRKREIKENSERLLHGYAPKEVSEVPIGILVVGATLFVLFIVLLLKNAINNHDTRMETVETPKPLVTATVPPTQIPKDSPDISTIDNNEYSESDYSDTIDETAPVSDIGTSERLGPQVVSYEYCLSQHGYLMYYVKLYNPSSDSILEFPTIRITARDADGIILGSEEQTFDELYPEHESNYACQAFAVDETPESVTIEPLDAKEYAIVSINKAEHKEFSSLTVTGVTLRNGKVVGEVINNNNYSIDKIWLSVIYRNSDGEMVNASFNFFNNLPANGSIPFSFSTLGYSSEEIHSVDIYAEPWG